jgi:hypothetical protein
MRVAFLLTGNEHRNGHVDGDTIRANVGASGTDQTTIVVAEYLAAHGHEVTIAAPNGGVPGHVVRGVTYTDLAFNATERAFDVLVNTLWFDDFKSLPITIAVAIVSWVHVPYVFGFDQIKAYIAEHKLSYGVVHLSNWCLELNTATATALCPEVVEVVIPNPLMSDVVEAVLAEPEPPRAERDCIFHAAWSRGGHLALRSLRELGWTEARVHVCDYLLGRQGDPMVVNVGSVGKADVLREIRKCGYFVYPLVREDGEMHKDTFACVIAEAMAMGAIAITYPVAALPETYGDTCRWLPFPDGCADLEHLRVRPLSHDVHLLTTDNIKEALLELDADPAARSELRARAQRHVLERYSSDRVGAMWSALLDQLAARQAASFPPAP